MSRKWLKGPESIRDQLELLNANTRLNVTAVNGAAQMVYVPQAAIIGTDGNMLLWDKTRVYSKDYDTGVIKSVGIAGNIIEMNVEGSGVVGETVSTPGMQAPMPRLKPRAKKHQFNVGSYLYMDDGLRYTLATNLAQNFWYSGLPYFESTGGHPVNEYNSSTSYVPGQHVWLGTRDNLFMCHANSTGVSPVVGQDTPNWLPKPPLKYYPDRHYNIGHFHGDGPTDLAYLFRDSWDSGADFAILQPKGEGGYPPVLSDGVAWSAGVTSAQGYLKAAFVDVPIVGLGGETDFRLATWLPHSGTGTTVTNGHFSATASYMAGQSVINSISGGDNVAYVVREGETVSAGSGRPDQNLAQWETIPIPTTWQGVFSLICNSRYRKKYAYINHTPANISKFPDREIRKLAVVYIHDASTLRDAAGLGTYRRWLRLASAHIRDNSGGEFDGIAVFARNSISPLVADGVSYGGLLDYDADWQNTTNSTFHRVLHLRADYEGIAASYTITTIPRLERKMQDVTDSFPSYNPATSAGHAESRRVFLAQTSYTSIAPHPSSFYAPGHSPKVYHGLLSKIVSYNQSGGGYPHCIMNGQLNERNESGPGVACNNQDGFGYIDASRAVFVEGYSFD